MDPLEDAGEESKCGIVHQLLCMACLGPGQTLHVLKHQALQLYTTTVNSGQQLIHNVSPRVCWECEILLKKVIHFRERVTECHDILNSSQVTLSEVKRLSRLQKSTAAQIDIPPLDTKCSMSEVKQEIEQMEEQEPSATDNTQPSEVKIEIEEYDPLETKDVQLSEVKQEIELCMGCLCGGRRLNNIRDKELKYYTDILNQKTVVSAVSPQVCCECWCMLRQATRFGEKMRQSYETIIPSLLTADIQDITSLLCSGVSLPPRLRRCVRDRVDIPPRAHTHDPPPPVKLEPGSLGLGDSSPPPAGHVQRTDAPATEVEHTSSRDTAHVTTSSITSERRHRECTSKQRLSSNMYPHNTSVCEDNSHVCVESALQDPRRRKQSALVTSHAADKPYQCNECSKTFRFKSRLIYHIRTHTAEKLKPYQCSQCTKAYTSKQNFVHHMKTHSGEKPYQCSQCSKAYTFKQNFVHHMTTHSGVKPYQCSQCSKAYSFKQILVQHMTTHSRVKPYQCSQCSKAYKRKNTLVYHMKTHSAKRPNQCSQCSKSYTYKHQLSQHITIHSAERPYQCSQCSKAYTYKHHLAQHMTTHSGEKPYQCSQCSKAFTSKHHLAQHMTTHSVEKPYQCSQCFKAFICKRYLVDHMTTHSGEKPYQCSQCFKAFICKRYLVRHMATHSGEKHYQCSHCTKSYSFKKNLVNHMSTHSGVWPYKCTQCAKAFSRKENLVRHMTTHSGKKLYQCSHCSKAFTRKYYLAQHIKTHTKD